MASIYPIQTLQYSPYIYNPLQDIENQYKENMQDIEKKISDLHTTINENNKLHNKKIEKLQKDFNENIKIRLADGIVGIVLFIIIYVKVFTSLPM
jgi:hypothetical protein